MSPTRFPGTLHTDTWILCVSMYSRWSWKNFVEMQLSASLAACFFVGSRTSQVVKLHLQKYCLGIPAVCMNSLKVSFFSLANLMVLMSVTMSKRIWGSRTVYIFLGWARWHCSGNMGHSCPLYFFGSPPDFFDGLSRRLALLWDLDFHLAFILVELGWLKELFLWSLRVKRLEGLAN